MVFRLRSVPVVLVLSLFHAPAPGAAQRWTLPEPAKEGIDSVFSFVGRDAPGCAVGVVRDGRMAYARGYGLANLDWGIPITPSTVFDIGSVSKQFTAAAVALLDVEGVLSLDDDVRRWVPELPDYGHPLTLRHLLNHTGGVRDYLTLLRLAGFDYDNVFDEQDGIDVIVRQQGLNFTPGSEYLYSNSGYLLLANIVRRATGRSLRAFLEERVFDPLGMAHSTIWDRNTEILAERATGYAPDGSGWRIDHAWNFQMGGDGQVVTSVEDLALWDANFYDPRVGGAGLLERLHTRGILTSGDTIPYALGLSVDTYRGLRRVAHGGAWAGFRAHLARFPDQRASVIIACNRADANTGRYASAVADLVLADAFPEAPAVAPASDMPPAEPADAEPARWAGTYRHAERPAYVSLVADDGGLAFAGSGTRLSPVDGRTFRTPGGALVRFSEEGERVTVSVGSDRYGRVAPAAPGPAELASLAGSYRSPELDASWSLDVDDGRLRATLPGGETLHLDPGIAEEYFGPVSITVVRRDGRVAGLRVYAGRVTGIEFTKVLP